MMEAMRSLLPMLRGQGAGARAQEGSRRGWGVSRVSQRAPEQAHARPAPALGHHGHRSSAQTDIRATGAEQLQQGGLT